MSDGAERVGVVVMSHGTPTTLDQLLPFYTEIRRGHPPSREQLTDLERRYRAIGGVSPLNDRTREQVLGLGRALEVMAPQRFVVTGGTKFADPRIEDAVARLGRAGVERAVGIVLAPHSADVSVGEYSRRVRAAAAVLENGPLPVDVVDHWHLVPGFVELLARRVRDALETLPAHDRASAVVLFTAHSVPVRAIDGGDRYAIQVNETAQAVAKEAMLERWEVCWQSAGRTDDVWLGPDLLTVLAGLADAGETAVVVCPAGFVSDHLEVLFDVDIEARALATTLGLAFVRTASLNADPRFCEVLARVVLSAAGAPGNRRDD
ncbi:MAG TPA: ferrochelatase [Acidimicrobiales bacterium]|nr:ferrochelatase [Acidimicrobiales bacterium]